MPLCNRVICRAFSISSPRPGSRPQDSASCTVSEPELIRIILSCATLPQSVHQVGGLRRRWNDGNGWSVVLLHSFAVASASDVQTPTDSAADIGVTSKKLCVAFGSRLSPGQLCMRLCNRVRNPGSPTNLKRAVPDRHQPSNARDQSCGNTQRTLARPAGAVVDARDTPSTSICPKTPQESMRCPDAPGEPPCEGISVSFDYSPCPWSCKLVPSCP